jgi:energy-converting hydrogenase Eha subunit E
MNRRTFIVLVAAVFGAALSVLGFVGTVGGQVRVNPYMNAIAIASFLLAVGISALMFLVQEEPSPVQ